MKVNRTYEYTIDVELERDDMNAYVMIRRVDGDGGEFFTPNDAWEYEESGFEGIAGFVYDVIPLDQVGDRDDDDVLRDYFAK